MTLRPLPLRRQVTVGALAEEVRALLEQGYRLALAAAHDDRPALRVVYLFTRGTDDTMVELTLPVPVARPAIPTLASISLPASRFEREMHDLFGIVPDGHPLPRRLVRHDHWPRGWYPLRHDAGAAPEFTDASQYPFLTVDGPGVFEIPVGPVHAGLIEPGHFRFSVVGETILKLKARLWFVHRGVEGLFQGRPARDAVGLAERISGDTAIGHGLAYSVAVEDALGLRMTAEGDRLRGVLLELERLYNHVADLGALANDVGFGLAQGHAHTLRERLLRLNAHVTGHRLLRGAIGPGVVRLNAAPDLAELREIGREIDEIATLTLAHSVVHDRFVGTGVLTREQASDLGCLGPVARASGIVTDARAEHPIHDLPVDPVIEMAGDVLARYNVRRREIAASIPLIEQLLAETSGLSAEALPDRPARRSGVGLVEGWRGAIATRIELDHSGVLTRAKVVDPSWFNWPALPLALTDAIVADFPLVNKSFNLSYAGNDL